MSQTIINTCDLCGSTEEVEKVRIPCTFTTETTEGRGVEPYLTNDSVDVCEKCLDRITNEQPVWASGAQGHNNFYWKNNVTDYTESTDA